MMVLALSLLLAQLFRLSASWNAFFTPCLETRYNYDTMHDLETTVYQIKSTSIMIWTEKYMLYVLLT